jgi:hypothetical protein
VVPLRRWPPGPQNILDVFEGRLIVNPEHLAHVQT